MISSARHIASIFLLAILLAACHDDTIQTPPVAALSVFPFAGDTTTIFTFDATKSADAEDVRVKLRARWDWNNDGTWDTEPSSELKVLHQFRTRGIVRIKMQLIDSDGLTAELTDSVRVFPIPVTGTMTDPRDGRSYRTVQLEGSWWMAESLKYGMVLSSDSVQKDNGTIEGYAYGNDTGNVEGYGLLYAWFEAVQYNENEQTQGVCPPGWHVPSDREWNLIAPRDVPYLYLNYYYGPGGPGGLNLTYGGDYTLLYETRDGQYFRHRFGGLGSQAGFWTSTHKELVFQDFAGHTAWQRWNLGKWMDNPLTGIGMFDGNGLYTMGDRIHLRGDPAGYDASGTYIVNNINAFFVRCVKDP